ncbi:MAG: glycosyltransferase family 2 protein [Candidatus Liberibacter ctenarytainae]|uniref:Glycosyltransferase family 2 protein n=1 Tax=Candidatus Liberibacter ctenarytainae TaxID=2020335 RepID=A0A937AQY9_9HYPH|nr:glycosyltransferase family 2 protein [Candidatus Liberibacter ctenarytainae]
MPVYKVRVDWLKEAINSVRDQLYPYWELCIAEDCSNDIHITSLLKKYAAIDPRIKVVFHKKRTHISAASNSAAAMATGEWIALLDHDDLLDSTALWHAANTINSNPTAEIIYSDEDKIDESGTHRHGPYFKYDFNIDLFYSHNMITHLGIYKSKTFRKIGGFREGFEGSQDYDLVLRFLDEITPSQIIHIPRILYHWRAHQNSTAQTIDNKSYAITATLRAINEHFQRQGIKATSKYDINKQHTCYHLPDPLPLVSIIIPTCNQHLFLRQCLKSIYNKTAYSNFEVIVVDNNSDDAKSLAYLETIKIKYPNLRLTRDKTAPFNYSRINNNAILHAKGEYFCFLNDDTRVINKEWLHEMMGMAIQPKIGAVGARLWYKNDTLQHAGVIMGIGNIAGHKNLHRRINGHHNNHQFFAIHVQHAVSAVTGACMVISKECFLKVGGFDDENTPVGFSDTDLCLRILESGYRNVWTPYANLYHYESQTRGPETATKEKWATFEQATQYIRRRWKDIIEKDPNYNPNLTLDNHSHELARPPRLSWISSSECYTKQNYKE